MWSFDYLNRPAAPFGVRTPRHLESLRDQAQRLKMLRRADAKWRGRPIKIIETPPCGLNLTGDRHKPLLISASTGNQCLAPTLSCVLAARAPGSYPRGIYNISGQPKSPSPWGRLCLVVFIALSLESFFGVHAGRMVLSLQHLAVCAQKCDVLRIPNKNVAVHDGAIEGDGGRSRYAPRRILGNTERPFLTCGQRKYEIDKADAVEMSDVPAIFSPNDSVVIGAKVVPLHDPRGEARFVRVPV